MISVAAEIVAHGPAHRFRHSREIGEKCYRRCGGETGIFFDEPVQRRDIGPMMLVMMDRHGQSINVGFKPIVPIAERKIGVCQFENATPEVHKEPELATGFKQWLRKHRGAADPTIKQYARDAAGLMMELGDNPSCWNATDVRKYFMQRSDQVRSASVEKLITSLRAFLRYLAVEGKCPADLAKAVPAYASWHLAELPRYLTAEQVISLIAASDGVSPGCRRDRAILLLLVRLGLRAGDVAQLRLADIEWETGSLRVCGKSRYQVRLPLPQEVGDAIIAYLECRPSACQSDHVFLPTEKLEAIESIVPPHLRKGVSDRQTN